jgi:hypothetical protein
MRPAVAWMYMFMLLATLAKFTPILKMKTFRFHVAKNFALIVGASRREAIDCLELPSWLIS